jgi:serine phosphatase RsbU (regulator of sigma subunit)
VLLLYTDGIVEATVADGEQFGRERLIEFLLANRHLDPTELIDRLFARISSSAQEDDLTAIVVEAK